MMTGAIGMMTGYWYNDVAIDMKTGGIGMMTEAISMMSYRYDDGFTGMLKGCRYD